MTGRYSLLENFIADRWQIITPRATADLPAHIRGTVYWVDYGEPNKSCYHVKDQDDGREYAVEFINDAWHVLDWMSGGWRTHASKYFSTKDREHMGLGWYDKSDPEHLDYTYVSVRMEEEDPKNKGKAKALSRTASVDFHSPRELEAVIGDESEGKEESPQGPVPRVPTPMPGTWAENLEERALAPQLGEIVQIDPGDFGQPGPEYGQRPKMTNIEARVLLGNDPGDKRAIEPSALGTTFGINKAFVSSFGQPSLLKAAARIATTMTTPMNPVFVATQHKTSVTTFPFSLPRPDTGPIPKPQTITETLIYDR